MKVETLRRAGRRYDSLRAEVDRLWLVYRGTWTRNQRRHYIELRRQLDQAYSLLRRGLKENA